MLVPSSFANSNTVNCHWDTWYTSSAMWGRRGREEGGGRKREEEGGRGRGRKRKREEEEEGGRGRKREEEGGRGRKTEGSRLTPAHTSA